MYKSLARKRRENTDHKNEEWKIISGPWEIKRSMGKYYELYTNKCNNLDDKVKIQTGREHGLISLHGSSFTMLTMKPCNPIV